MKKKHLIYLISSIILAVIALDQTTKILVKTNMVLGENFSVLGNWFKIYFVENKGIAFGITFDFLLGKPILTVFRVIVAGVIGYYIFFRAIPKKQPAIFIVSLALILGGAIGNIIDSLFYGIIFSDSYSQVATFLPETGGYSSFLWGNVVDMLYFPLFRFSFPEWLPIWSGESFLFFSPIFNIADSALTVGMALLLIFSNKRKNREASGRED